MSTEVEHDGENAIRVFTLSGTPYERGFSTVSRSGTCWLTTGKARFGGL